MLLCFSLAVFLHPLSLEMLADLGRGDGEGGERQRLLRRGREHVGHIDVAARRNAVFCFWFFVYRGVRVALNQTPPTCMSPFPPLPPSLTHRLNDGASCPLSWASAAFTVTFTK